MATEISEGTASQENSNRFVNFKDCRPSAKLKAAGKKPNAKGGVNGNPNPNQTQQNVMTNALIAEKLNKQSVSTDEASSQKSKTQQKPKSKGRIGTANGAVQSARSGLSGTTQQSTAAKGGVVKTIVLPHEDMNRLGTDGQLLVQVLEQQKSLFEDTVSGYQKDRSVRTQEFDLKQRDHEMKMAELQARLHKDKELNSQIAGDFFNYKHQIGLAKQHLDDQL